MNAYKQIVHAWMFGDIPFADMLGYVRQTGADGIDLSISLKGRFNNAQLLLEQDLQEMLAQNHLEALSVTPLFFHDTLDLSHKDAQIRQAAVSFAKNGIDVAAHAGCKRMLVSASYVDERHQYHISHDQDWRHSVNSLMELSDYGAKKDVLLMLEPINRYRVSLVHTVDEALRMIRDVAHPNLHMVPDTFHMQIEEPYTIAEALRAAGKCVQCLHIGDSNRMPPGFGVMDWTSIIRALRAIDFTGPLSHEPVGLYFDAQRVACDEAYRQTFIHRVNRGVMSLKDTMQLA